MSNPSEMVVTKNSPNGRPPDIEITPVVVKDAEDGLIAQWNTSQPKLATNLDMTTPSGRALMTRCLAKCSIKTRNAVGKIINVIGYVVHVAQLTDVETAEMTQRLRAVLVCDDGTLISTMSGPVLTTLCNIATLRGRGQWNPPSRLEIRQWDLEEGKSYCDLIEHEPEPAKPTKPTK